MQLDHFLDSRAVMLANDVIGALAARDPERARAVLGHLHSEAPEYPGIDAFERLTVALATWSAPGANATAINSEVDRLDRDIVPAAHQILGEVAAAFVAGFFRILAQAARGLDYDPAHPHAHRAWLCLRCGEWQEAGAAAETIPQSHSNPDAIRWGCVARYRLRGLAAARSRLFALALWAPSRFASMLAELADEVLWREWRRFETASDWASVHESELPAWFPAWFLLEHPAAGAEIEDAVFPATAAAQAARLVRELLELDKQGFSQRLVAGRARLRELNREIFALYMANRTIQRR